MSQKLPICTKFLRFLKDSYVNNFVFYTQGILAVRFSLIAFFQKLLFKNICTDLIRSSHLQMFCKKDVQNSQENTCVRIPF